MTEDEKMKMNMKKIIIKSCNKEELMTCGSCKHADNDLGLVALHCDLICGTSEDGEYNDGKVRSWEKCSFNPSRYEKRIAKDNVIKILDSEIKRLENMRKLKQLHWSGGIALEGEINDFKKVRNNFLKGKSDNPNNSSCKTRGTEQHPCSEILSANVIEELIDELDKHFPKGESKERGQAMVLLALFKIKLEEVISAKDSECSDRLVELGLFMGNKKIIKRPPFHDCFTLFDKDDTSCQQCESKDDCKNYYNWKG